MLALLSAALLLAEAPPACKIQGQPTLAILDVRVSGVPPEMVGLLSDALRGELVNTRCFKVQDAAQMREIFKAQELNASEVCDESCVVERGRLLQVRYLASAQVYGSSTGAVALARLTDVETGTSVESAQVTRINADLPNLLDAVKELAGRISGGAKPLPEARGTRGFQAGRIGEDAPDFTVEGAEEVVVKFESAPAGAVVLVDGTLLCQTTPCSKQITVGQHEVAMQKERYEPASARTVVGRGSKVALNLTPTFGWLSVETAPPGLTIAINGKTEGQSPLAEREVPPGGYEIVVDDPCWIRSGERVALAKGERRAISITPKKTMAALKVSAQDRDGNAVEGTVLVDGAELGVTPGTYKVPACSRALAVRSPGGQQWTAELALRERETKVLQAVFTPDMPVVGPAVATPEAPRVAPDQPLIDPGSFVLRAGFGGVLGVLGAGLEYRMGSVGLAVGSGTHALGGGLSFTLFDDGGPYLDLHAVWVRPGLLGGALAAGTGFGATLGWDLRPVEYLSLKAGVGLAWNTASMSLYQPRPLVFDGSVGFVFPTQASLLDDLDGPAHLAIRAGFGTQTGILGVGIEYKVGAVGIAVGTGTHLLTGGLTFGLPDNSGGPYLDLHAAWSRVGFVGKSLSPGVGFGATAGWDLRPVDYLSIKGGVGLAWNTATMITASPRPLVFDFCVGPVF